MSNREPHTRCTQCQREILVATAQRSDGLCGVCNRKANEKKRVRPDSSNQPAAKSADELVLLRKVVRHLDSIEPKRIYADWLARHGEITRAEFVQRFMMAYESLAEEDLPDCSLVDPCWSRMVGGHYLRVLIQESTHLTFDQRKSFRDLIFRFAEPSIVVRYCTGEEAGIGFNPKRGESRYFGIPDLGDDMRWPTYADCMHDFEDTEGEVSPNSPCLFACQIQTKDLWPFTAGDLASQAYLMSLFTYVEEESLGSQSVCVLTQNNSQDLKSRRQPAGATDTNSTIPARPIFFLEELTLPQSFCSKFAEIQELDQLYDNGADLYDVIAGAGRAEWKPDWTDLNLFGYLRASSGGDPAATTSHRLFASVRCSVDAGIIYLGIDPTSLMKQDWEKSQIAWLDWDG